MPVDIVCFCSYLVTDDYSKWCPDDHIASKFVNALKGEELKGYAYVPVLGLRRYLGNANLDDAIGWFADMVASHMQRHRMHGPFALVPVPNSGNTVRSSTRPRTVKLARATAPKIVDGTKVLDCLRWKKDLGSARRGAGTRDPATLYQNLAFISKLPVGTPYILIDDVLTTGGHLQACIAKLTSGGAAVIAGFCAGRTVHDPPEDPFAVTKESVPDYLP